MNLVLVVLFPALTSMLTTCRLAAGWQEWESLMQHHLIVLLSK